MSLRVAVQSLERKLGLVAGATETCATCGEIAPAGCSITAADGPTVGERGETLCPRCRLPVSSEGVIVRRWGQGYRVHAKLIDLR